MKPHVKEKPWRSKRYLKWIRSHDCACCGWPAYLGNIDAHHVVTSGARTKCGDDKTVPMCSYNVRGCHNKADKNPASVECYLPIAGRLYREWKKE